MTPATTTREQWLSNLVEVFRGWFADRKHMLPKVVRVSVGFPSSGALSERNRTIGQCWPATASKDGSTHVFVSPVIGDALRVSDVLLHELCHAVAGHAGQDCGHKGAFKRIATEMGLTGKMTATEPTPELLKRLNVVVRKLGKYPHAMLDPKKSPVKKQSTRLLKAMCSRDGYVIRVTQKWVDELGMPACPCGGKFKLAEIEEDGE
jgi:hypothetical protein